MRKIFAGATIFSLIGAALLGGVFAFQVSDHIEGENTVGNGGIELDEQQLLPNLLGPNGSDVVVALADIDNVGDFFVKDFGGEVHISEVSQCAEDDEECVDTLKCNTTDFGGFIWYEGEDWLAPHDDGNGDAQVSVFITMAEDAPDTCQGRVVSWEAWITAESFDPEVHEMDEG
jgi:hypothetical protein